MARALTPTIVVHGGAQQILPELEGACLAGVRAAAEQGRALLLRGAPAEDAVVAAIRVLEDDPAFNAGRGACMNADGEFEVDAALMRGRDRRLGAVAGVRDLRDPIVVARAVLEHTPHHLLVGAGAEAFARARGLGCFGRAEVHTTLAEREWEQARPARGGDTVGAVALDLRGELAAGGSTGGTPGKLPGRVGDTPLPGAGIYARAGWGATVATGLGEAITAEMACYAALARVIAGEGAQAVVAALCDAIHEGHGAAPCGMLLLSAAGDVGIAHRSPHMSWACARGDAPVEAGLRR
jgi:beta-aspartyl-peptidase (threonine type)